MPDTGDPTNFGGKAVEKMLKPGGIFVKEARLSDWFRFDKPDSYRITGMFRMGLRRPGEHLVAWDDFAIGECTVRIVRKPATDK